MPAKSEMEQLGLFDDIASSSDPKEVTPSQPHVICPHCVEQYLSDHQVAERYGIAKATVWRWHDSNPDFPRRIKMSPGTSRWKLSDLVRFELRVQVAGQKNPKPLAKGTFR